MESKKAVTQTRGRKSKSRPRPRRRAPERKLVSLPRALPSVSSQEWLTALLHRVAPIEKKSDEEWTKVESKRPALLKATAKDLMALIPAARGPRGLQVRIKLCLGSQMVVNSGLGKYLQFFFNSFLNLSFNNVASAVEFSTLDVLFDEVFIHSVTIVAKSRNKHNGLYQSAGNATDLASCLATLYFLPHNAVNYTDASGTYASAAIAAQHKLVNLGDDFTWVVRNPTRFDPDADTGDESTAGNTMGWCLFGSVSTKYGGTIGMATPVASGASIGAGVLVEGALFNDYIAYYDLSVRARA